MKYWHWGRLAIIWWDESFGFGFHCWPFAPCCYVALTIGRLEVYVVR